MMKKFPTLCFTNDEKMFYSVRFLMNNAKLNFHDILIYINILSNE
mgnify:CR=1 FL=1